MGTCARCGIPQGSPIITGTLAEDEAALEAAESGTQEERFGRKALIEFDCANYDEKFVRIFKLISLSPFPLIFPVNLFKLIRSRFQTIISPHALIFDNPWSRACGAIINGIRGFG